MTLTPREWEVLTGQVARSDDLAESIKAALDDSTRVSTVPVTQLMPDGVKQVVGHAQIHRDGENVLATFTMQSSSVSKHLGGTLGPFSIGIKQDELVRERDPFVVAAAKQQSIEGITCNIHLDVMLEWDGYTNVCSRCVLG